MQVKLNWTKQLFTVTGVESPLDADISLLQNNAVRRRIKTLFTNSFTAATP